MRGLRRRELRTGGVAAYMSSKKSFERWLPDMVSPVRWREVRGRFCAATARGDGGGAALCVRRAAATAAAELRASPPPSSQLSRGGSLANVCCALRPTKPLSNSTMSTSPAASQLRIPAHMLYSPGDAARADRSFVSGIRMTAHGTEGERPIGGTIAKLL